MVPPEIQYRVLYFRRFQSLVDHIPPTHVICSLHPKRAVSVMYNYTCTLQYSKSRTRKYCAELTSVSHMKTLYRWYSTAKFTNQPHRRVLSSYCRKLPRQCLPSLNEPPAAELPKQLAAPIQLTCCFTFRVDSFSRPVAAHRVASSCSPSLPTSSRIRYLYNRRGAPRLLPRSQIK